MHANGVESYLNIRCVRFPTDNFTERKIHLLLFLSLHAFHSSPDDDSRMRVEILE